MNTYTNDDINRNLLKVIEDTFKECFDLPAFTDYDTDETFTYGNAAQEIACLHALFRTADIKAGDKVALMGADSARWCIIFIATITYGAVIVPILQDFNPQDAERIIDLLGLPEYTFPAVGLAVGWPNQEPQLKPRLPKEVMHMENQYQALENPLKDIEAYDEEITGYYDTRDLNNRVDRFSKQVADKMETLPPKRLALLEVIQQQGFLKEQ